MDKKTKTTIIIISIVGVLLIALMIGLFALLGKTKNPITAEEFKNIMEQKEYITGDATAQYDEYGYVNKVYIAATKDRSYQIEFYVLEDIEYAKSFYNTNKKIFEEAKVSVSAESNVNLKNSSKYTLSSNGEYKVVSRIDNTVIYVDTEDKNRDIVKDILKELGY